jgi:outer membrane protein, heavy metal efflux system
MWFYLRDWLSRSSHFLFLGFLLSLGFAISMPLMANETEQDNPLKQAMTSAWAKQPIVNSALQRRSEFRARKSEASNLLKGPAAISFENWTDRFSSRAGLVKYAAEFALPLWLPNEKVATRKYIEDETQYFEALLLSMQLKTGNDVREAYWAAKLSEVEVLNAENQLRELTLLSNDMNRRLMAGLVSRYDVQITTLQMQQSAQVLARANVELFSKRIEFERLTGAKLTSAYAFREIRPTVEQEHEALARHPSIVALKISAQVAQRQLQLVKVTTRDTPELGIGMFKERNAFGAGFENVLTVRLRVPFSSDSRSTGRMAAASASVNEAQANVELETARIDSQKVIAKAELKSIEEIVLITETRLALATDNLKLAQKAFELGQIDLPARLRAQNELFEVSLSRSRNQIEHSRAISRLNQALGLLP